MIPSARPCPTCGANNEDVAIDCSECHDPISENVDGGDYLLAGLTSFPASARWLVALPGISTIAAVVIRQLATAGIHDYPNAAMYAVAMAVAIFAAAYAAAFIAPSYRTYVGLSVAVAELAVIFKALMSAASQDIIFQTRLLPAWIAVLYILIPLIGIILLTILLFTNKSLIDEPSKPGTLPGDIILQWWLGIAAALGLGAAFDAIVVGAGALCPACLPKSSSESLGAVIGTAITIALVADYAPSKKMVAARLIAGLTMLACAITTVLWVANFFRYPVLPPYVRLEAYYALLFSAELVAGAAIGLRAAAIRHGAGDHIGDTVLH